MTPDGRRRRSPGATSFLVLELRTIVSEACTWEVSPETLTIKITSGDDDIWSSRQCPRAVPDPRRRRAQAATTTVGVTWNGRRSDDECSRLTDWALPGYYHVAAAALAGEPADVQFELEAPTAAGDHPRRRSRSRRRRPRRPAMRPRDSSPPRR